MRKFLIITILILIGCNGTHSMPQVGSIIRPETNLTQFSDDYLLAYYYDFSEIIANQERDISLLATGKAGLAGALVYDLDEWKARHQKNKQAQERMLQEIKRRGLSVEKRSPRRIEFGRSFAYGWKFHDSQFYLDIW